MIPQSNADELVARAFERVRDLHHTKDKSSFMAKRLSREVNDISDKLLSQDAFHAYMLKGALASIDGRRDSVDSFYRKTKALQPNNWITYFNYAKSLEILQDVDGAERALQEASNVDPGCLEVRRYLVDTLMHSGQFKKAFDAAHEAEKLQDDVISEDLRQLGIILRIMDESGMTEERTRKLSVVAHNLLAERGFVALQIDNGLSHDGRAEWISQTLRVGASFDEVMDLNFELADRIGADLELSETSSRYIIRFTSSPEMERMHAC